MVQFHVYKMGLMTFSPMFFVFFFLISPVSIDWDSLDFTSFFTVRHQLNVMPNNIIVIQVIGKTDTNFKTGRHGDYFFSSGHKMQKVFCCAALHYQRWAKISLLIVNQCV